MLILTFAVTAALCRYVLPAHDSPESNLWSYQSIWLWKFHRDFCFFIQCRGKCVHELDPTDAGYYSLCCNRSDNATFPSYGWISG